MTILHYTLGLAPQRSGGMTKYATDLMQEQAKEQHTVLLYPSGYRWWSKKIYWKIGGVENNTTTFLLKNTLPISLLYGIKSPADFVNNRTMKEEDIASLYNEIKPDIMHVHTLMGLPKELLLYFKSRGVKLVYTSHDYFGICPKVNLINECGELCNNPSPENCKRCNTHAKSTLFLRFRNSRFALNIKNNKILRKILR